MGGTCYAMGLMLAYNQFSGNSALLNYNTSTFPAVNANDAGGGGRVGGAENRHLRDRRRTQRHPRRPLSSTAERTTPITRSATTRPARPRASIPTMSTATTTTTPRWSVRSCRLSTNWPRSPRPTGTARRRSRCCCIALPSVRRSPPTASARSTRCRRRAMLPTARRTLAELQDHQRQCQHLCDEPANSLRHNPAGWSPGVADPVMAQGAEVP